MSKSNVKKIRVLSRWKELGRSIRPYVDVPCQWEGKWVIVNRDHYFPKYGPLILLSNYVITHRGTTYAIHVFEDGERLSKIKKIAEKLDKLGAGCWDFKRPRTAHTQRWQKQYMSEVNRILGKEVRDESKGKEDAQ